MLLFYKDVYKKIDVTHVDYAESKTSRFTKHLNPRRDSTGMNDFCSFRSGRGLQETIEVTLDYMLEK